VIAVIAILLLASGFFPLVSFAQSSDSQTLIEMGYGPSALKPISDGVPVYTVGDQLWVSSNYHATINVSVLIQEIFGNNSSVVSTLDRVALSPSTPVPLLTFSQAYQEGIWSLEVQPSSGSAFSVPIRFVKLSSHQIEPRLNSSILRGDSVSLSFGANLSDAYDVESCVPSNPSADRVLFSLPPSIGTGFLGVQRNGSSLLLSANGTILSPFTFWFELYHPYSFSVIGTGELISRSIKSAESTPVLIQFTGSTNTTLLRDTQLRQGRSTVRAFFDNAKGLVVEEASALISNDNSWVWLGPLCSTSPVSSESFSDQTTLANGVGSLPTSLHLMYRVSGVEAVSSVPISINASKIAFFASPWGAPLSDANITLASLNGTQTSTVGGIAYVISSSYPVSINYTINLLGRSTTGLQTIFAPYTTNQVSIPLGELNVQVVNGGLPGTNVSVRLISTDTGISMTKTTGNGGIATFLIPGGSYTANASVAGQSQMDSIRIIDGNQTAISLNFAGTTLSSIVADYLQTALIVAAVVGVLANIILFVFRRRLRPAMVPR
jgi:hypothetical protein